jgi:hypothetical protein
MLSVTFYFFAECHFVECQYAECHYAECLYAECHYAECHYAMCHYAECHYAESHYAVFHYAERHNAECSGGASHISPSCWVSLCCVSYCRVSWRHLRGVFVFFSVTTICREYNFAVYHVLFVVMVNVVMLNVVASSHLVRPVSMKGLSVTNALAYCRRCGDLAIATTTFSITALGLMTFSTAIRKCNTLHNAIQHNTKKMRHSA